MVTLGDGSVHNHHFWSAFHLARHARHKRIKCPVLFGISDNGLSISYSTEGYVDTLFDNDPLIPVFRANGSDTMDVYSQTRSAIEYARRQSAPAIIIYKNIVRRFGHAASDRQAAYLDDEQIQNMANTDVVGSAIVQAVEISAATNYISVQKRLTEIEGLTLSAFALSSNEEKVTREEMLQQLWAPVVSVNTNHPLIFSSDQDRKEGEKVDVMRKHMNRVIAEAMEDDNRVIYLGEDVAHGGYYVVTEGLAEKFPGRVLDFPPDETSLLGAAMGFAQVGLIPIIEIPYAKYLDCGADMFNEIAISYWLSRGKRPNGMIVRLQGFDRGLFGGNFHTSNQLNLIPPGIHVVCYSNGEDYAMGFRNALDQAKQGSVVVSVDCTNLLNLRHLHDKDRGWERSYPPKQKIIGFDFVRRYGKEGKHAIVTYGNGVVTAIQARKLLSASGEIADHDIDVVDCPLLSSVPKGLRTIVSQYESVIFADVCKEGPGGNILSSLACSLQKEGRLPNKWQLVCAPRTYNPLGSFTTFLNVEDIVETFRGMHKGNHDTRQKAISQS
jgi:2-oxoisovalerate dehydrogenase E1 component